MPEIADALIAVGIEEAFPIQEMTLGVALQGTDLIGQARTGTGKTLAFSIPVIQRISLAADADFDEELAGKPQALIVAPTRELAIQVASDVAVASKGRGTRNLTIYGGVPYESQLDALTAGVDIVVGTPGRLLDLANRGALDLSHIRTLVLDEADEMLDLGFLPDVESLLAKTPESRQTMLFSATMPGAIVGLARKHMRHPMNIRAESGDDDSQMVPATAQFVWQAHDMDKPEIVGRILQAEDVGRVIIFTRTKRTAQRVADELIDRGFPASPLHGDMAQPAREKALARFREGKIDILVATDVAARGIDVAGITHVINYNCPEDDKTYVHRIGRTGRAGASGIAVTFVDWADITRWKLINKALGLPFDEPQETYSTSEHLFHDLGIDPNVKGRLKAASPREPKKDDDRGGRGGNRGGGREGGNRGGGGGGRDGGNRGGGDRGGRQQSSGGGRPQAAPDAPAPLPTGEDAPRIRKRSRTRTRSGQRSTNPE
ncbi:DEAD/DEAH box helicase [Aeromicrobium sp. CFBP 8757]|uniref:DEAD/DEAH box helicase n=1 Tax=Aeromicrobium sp. CFBP 8757 TaxID=2775288 RepID=UPI00177C54A9|nr:DEAD/DEAH box helicase [Aeromicrobium sp. CFBP 8757]MBD8605334.1 DEAD/DEAH box helicase [Aeromicrobium sp. CFBP 8757]